MDDILKYDFEEILSENDILWLKNKTVLITGVTGMIGSLLTHFLLYCNKKMNLNVSIIGLARNQKKAEKIYNKQLQSEKLKMIYSDITDPVHIQEAVDYIFHMASATTSKFFVTYPAETLNIMYAGTKNMLELAREKKVEGMLYVSSMEVYGIANPELEYTTEEDLGYIDILNVRSSYSEGKRISECLCAAYAMEFGVPVKIARLAQTFGAGILEEDNRVYAQFAKSVICKKDIVLHTAGKSWGNYCYTSDVLSAMLVLLAKGSNGQAYNVTNEVNTTTIRDMAEMVIQKFGNNNIKVAFEIPEDTLKYGYAPDVKMHLSAKKLQQLGWKPKVLLEEMYRRMLMYMKHNHYGK